MREESPDVSIAPARFHTLPDTAYNLWVSGELADHLHLPNDGSRVEVIGGEIVVSPGPDYAHNDIIQDVQRSLFAAEMADPAFPWRCILDRDVAKQARRARLKRITPQHVQLVLEVTSPSNAGNDQRPRSGLSIGTKWNGYARVGIAYYLLVDQDPRAAQSTLFANPDPHTGEYKHQISWEFGQTIRLPHPLDFEIRTADWEPWKPLR